MSAEFVSNLDNPETSSADKKTDKAKKAKLKYGQAAVEGPKNDHRSQKNERPKFFFSLEDDKPKKSESIFSLDKKEAAKPILPPEAERLKTSKLESDKEDDDDDDEIEATEKKSEKRESVKTDRLIEEDKPVAIEEAAELELEKLPPVDAGAEKTPEAVDVQAKRLFNENLKETKDIEAAAAATYEDLSIPPAEVEAAKAEITEQVSEPAAEEPPVEAAPEEPKELEEGEVNLHEAATEDAEQPVEAVEIEDEPEAATPPAAAGPPGPGGTPPHVMAGGLYGPGGPNGPDFSAARYAMSGNLNERQGHVPEYDKGNPAVTALIGAILGYRFGKRRGRRLERKQWEGKYNNLEKDVTDLHWQIKAKEGEIRRVAARKARIEGVVFMNRLDRAVEKSQARADRREFRKMEQSTAPRRQRAPEARHLHGAPKSHERIGHVLMAAEAASPITSRRPEAASAKKEAVRQASEIIGDRRVETLNRQELLQISEKIVVDGTTLRQIYESHLIGERGLRRLVAEHLHGGDIKKVLRQEIIEREIDFERDPVLRDQPLHGGGANGTGGAKTNKSQLNQLLAKAGASLPDTSEEAAFYKARAAYESAEREQQQKQKQLMDRIFVAIIFVLFGLIVLLAVH